jgi:hypothetical protein
MISSGKQISSKTTYPLSFLASLKKLYYSFSFKGKLITALVGLFMFCIWGLVFFYTSFLQSQFNTIIFDQQFESARRLAGELNTNLKERTQSLTIISENLPAELQKDNLQKFLSGLNNLHSISLRESRLLASTVS